MPKSIKEVNEMNKLYPIGYSPKQLLINNDFQVNQRGQSEYVSKGYSLDMWYFQNYNKANAKLEPTKNGIRMTNNDDSEMAIYQYAYAETKQIVTLVAKVNGKIYSISGLPTGSGETPTIVVEDGKIELNVRYYDTDKRYRVYAMVGSNNSASIEYIDLFEGDVAYLHAKEDKAIALQKCQSRVIVYDEVILPCIFSYNDKDYDGIVANLYLPTTFRGEPNISYDSKEMRSQHGGTTYTDFSIVSKKLYGANVIRIIWKKNSGVFSDTMKDIYVYMKNLLISCEPV